MVAPDTILTQFSQRYLPAKTVAGVHVRYLSAQQCTYTLCILKQDKQVLSIVEQHDDIQEIETLFSYLSAKVPVYLTVEGKGILIREVESGLGEPADMLQQLMPNAKKEDFYVQVSEKALVTVVRRTMVDTLLALFRAQDLSVLSLQVGPFAINTVIPFLEETMDIVGLPSYQLRLEDQQIKAITPAEETVSLQQEYLVGEEKIAAHELLSYATALSYFAPTETVPASTADSTITVHAEQAFYHRRFFTKAFPAVLGFFLIGLLINTVLYFQAFEQNQTLQTQSASDARLLSQLTKLQEEVESKEQFLSILGWEKAVSLTSLADRLAATVPPAVVLTHLAVSPLNEARYQKEKKQVFISNQLLVEGSCHDLLALNEWFLVLENSPWIAKLEDQQYIADPEQPGSGTFSFTIRLQP